LKNDEVIDFLTSPPTDFYFILPHLVVKSSRLSGVRFHLSRCTL